MDGTRVSTVAIALAAILSGCSQRDPLPFPRFAPVWDPASLVVDPRSNSFALYVRAASEFDVSLGPKTNLLLRTSYSPSQRDLLKGAARSALSDLQKARGRPCRVPYAPPNSQAALQYRSEWRLLGRTLCWRIDDDCRYEKYDDAIDHEILLTKFGFDLTSGPPRDVTLGLVLVDSGRKAIAGSLDRLDAKQLRRLAEGVKTVYLDRPNIAASAAAAARDMIEQVQMVQDSYRDQSYGWIEWSLGDQAKDAVEYLKELHQEPDQKRVAFFEGFAAEARQAGLQLQNGAGLSLRARLAQAPPAPTGQRPWKRLAKAFFGIGKPTLDMNDATCARTQLLILESEIMAKLKTDGQTPPDLGMFTRALTIDPYSGEAFVYRTDGRDHRLYSVGADLIDDNGETDESFTRPDLTLEKR